MIVSSEKRIVETEGLTEKVSSFYIKQSKRAFEILSSNIYSDKVMAVIREYSCNALDAQKATGTEDVPFSVHLPNSMEPYFSIRDYGTGLSIKDVTSLFTTYFESTKDTSNDYVGCMGLGSKSAFCYVDQFMVTSYFDGYKSVFSAHLSADGVPQITMLSTEESDEPCGLEINLMVIPSDFRAFEDKAKVVFSRFPAMPVVSGGFVELTPVKYVLKTKNYGLREYETGQRSSGGANVVQGVVAYRITESSFKTQLNWEERRILDLGIDFFVDLGEVGVTASRESLDMSPKTEARVLASIEDYKATKDIEIERLLNKAPSLFEAKVILGLLTRWGYTNRDNYKYKGNSIDGISLTTGIAPVNGTSTLHYMRFDYAGLKKGSRYKSYWSETISRGIKPIDMVGKQAAVKVIYVEDFSLDISYINKVIKYNYGDSSYNTNLHVFSFSSKSGKISDLVEALDGIPEDLIIRFSDLVVPVVPEKSRKSTSVKSQVVQAYKFNLSLRELELEERKVTTKDGGTYLIRTAVNFKRNKEILLKLRNLDEATREYFSNIVVFNSTYKSIPMKNPNWVDADVYFDSIIDQAQRNYDSDKVFECITKIRRLGSEDIDTLIEIEELGKVAPKLLLKFYKEFLDRVKVLRTAKVLTNEVDVRSIVNKVCRYNSVMERVVNYKLDRANSILNFSVLETLQTYPEAKDHKLLNKFLRNYDCNSSLPRWFNFEDLCCFLKLK